MRAGDDPAGCKRPADPRPQGRKLLRRTERQAKPGVDQGALAAAQVDRQAVLAGPEFLARRQQQRPRLTAS